MQIAENIRTKWGENLSRGDFKKIAKLAKVDPATIGRAFKGQATSPEVYNAVLDYYDSVRMPLIAEASKTAA